MSNKKSPVAKTKVNKTKDGQATKQAQAANKLKIKTKLDNKFLNEYLMKHEGKEKVAKSIPKVKELYNFTLVDEKENEKCMKELYFEKKTKGEFPTIEEYYKYINTGMIGFFTDYNDYINELKKEKTIKETPPLTLEQKKSLEDTSRYSLTENGWIKEYPMKYNGGNNFFSSIINWFKNLFK